MSARRPIKIRRRDFSSDSEDEVYLPKPMPSQVTPIKKTTSTVPPNRILSPNPAATGKPVSLSFILPNQVKSTNASAIPKDVLSTKTWNDIEVQTASHHCLADHLPLLIDSHNRFVDAIKHAFETLASSGHGCSNCQCEGKESGDAE